MNKRTVGRYLLILFSLVIIFSPFWSLMDVSLAQEGNTMNENQQVEIDGEKAQLNLGVEQRVEFVDGNERIQGELTIPAEFNSDEQLLSLFQLSVSSVDDGFPDGLQKAGLVADIQFYDDLGEKVNVEGSFTLSLRVDEGFASTANIYHEFSEGEWSKLESEVRDGFLTAEVNSFSKYGVFSEVVEEEDFEMIEITVSKEWVGAVGDPVTVYLHNDIENWEVYEAELSADNDWTYTFYDMYSLWHGTPVNYWLEEVEQEGYDVEISGSAEDGFVVTNTEIIPEPDFEMIEITVSKEWVGAVGDPVTVYLHNDIENWEVYEAELSADNDWTYTFYDMYSLYQGTPVNYWLEEVEQEGYDVEISGSAEDGFVVTNTEIIPEPDFEMMEITVSKEWVGTVGDPVTVYLYNDLGDGEGEVFEAELSADNDWTYTFYDMYSLYQGTPVNYWLEEVEQEGYDAEISGSAEDGFVVTNTEIKEEPEEPIVEEKEEEKEEPKGDVLPKTATNNFNLLLIGGIFLLLGSFVAIVYRRKRGNS